MIREKNIRDLEKKIYQDEEQFCTFSPKTNRGKINCHFSQKKKNNQLLEININNPRYCYSFKSANINNNINLNNKVNGKINNQIVYSNEQFAKTNPIFYPIIRGGKFGENKNDKFLKSKGKYAYNLVNNFDSNFINKSNKNKSKNAIKHNMININNKSFYEETDLNRTSRNYYFDYIKAKTNNSILNNNQIEENKSNPINISKNNNYLIIDNIEKNINENNFYKTHSNFKTIFKNRAICVKENINEKKQICRNT